MSVPDAPEARDLTEQEWDERVDAARAIEVRAIDAIKQGRSAMWELAHALYDFKEANGWMALGYDTVGEWLAQPEVTLRWRTFDRCVAVWRELVVHRGVDSPTLANLDLTKVDIALPAIRSRRAKLEDVLADVEVLPARDLREKYVQGSPETPGDDARTGDDQGAGDDTPAGTVALSDVWTDIEAAIESGAEFPRVRRDTLIALRDHYRSETGDDGSRN